MGKNGRSGNDGPEIGRRALLRRIGLATGIAYVAPALTALGIARASGEGSGEGWGGGGSGASGGGRGSRPSDGRPDIRRRAEAPAQTARRTPVRPAPPPEIVILVPFASTDDAAGVITSAGYRVLASEPGFAAGETILRLSMPPGRTTAQARDEIAVLVPGSLVDDNHLYVPDEFLCGPEGCAAHAMVGWNGWPSALAPRIGMIDTGINTDHDALRGQKLTTFQIDLADRDVSGRQHGTAIAAMLIGRTDGRVPGLLPMAELVAVEAFHSRGGADAADAFSLARAVEVLVEQRVQVINLSFSGPENLVLRRVIETAAQAGVGLVAAAGNGGPGAEPAFPAAWAEVVAVTAVDAEGNAYRQANRGPYVALAAPGVNIWTAASVSGGRLRSGTSYAAPFVTASLAIERLRSPDLPVTDTVARLIGCAKDLGDAGYDETFGHGLLVSPAQCTEDDAGGHFLTSGN